jgi:hypothetical protein
LPNWWHEVVISTGSVPLFVIQGWFNIKSRDARSKGSF